MMMPKMSPARTGFSVPRLYRAADYSPDLIRATDAKEAADLALVNARTEDELNAAIAIKAETDRTYSDLLLALDKKRNPQRYKTAS